MIYKKAFTLIELLVVISIIAILMSIMMPALNKARHQARMVVCSSNQKQLIYGLTTYKSDNNWYPPSIAGKRAGSNMFESNGFWTRPAVLNYHPDNAVQGANDGLAGGRLGRFMFPYIQEAGVYNCPIAKIDMDQEYWNGRTYQELYKDGLVSIGCSYNLLQNYEGFSDRRPGNTRQFIGPSRKSDTKLLVSDVLMWNDQAAGMGFSWISTHQMRNSSRNKQSPWYTLYDQSETVPSVEINAGYTDGSVSRTSSDLMIRQSTNLFPQLGIYLPERIR